MFCRLLSNFEHFEGKLVAVGEVGDNAPLGRFDKSLWTNYGQIKHEGTQAGEHFGLRVDKSLLSTPGRANNSCPTYYANRQSVPFTLDHG